jgi:hypothetical protein
MNKLKIPIKKVTLLYAYQGSPSTQEAQATSTTGGDPTIDCTTILTGTHLIFR